MSTRIRKGRRKLEMVKISKESNLLVTFSKRRYGVFKKASELSTLCGAEITLVVFSPGNKVFSFGHPSVEAGFRRFLSGKSTRISGAQQLTEAHRNARICELNAHLTQVQNLLEMEKKRGEEIDKMSKANKAQNWWECPIEELNLAQLQQLKTSLEVLKQNVGKQIEQLLIQRTKNNNNNNALFYGGFNSTINRLGFGNGFF